MVNIEYANAYNEVLEILKYIPREDYNKIPKKKIEFFKINASHNNTFKYNPTKTLSEQNVSKIAKGIIAILFRDYWATEIQKNKIIAKQNYDRMALEEKKREKYNKDNIFSHYSNNPEKDIGNNQELSLVEINNIKWYKKIWKLITNIFN